MSATLIAIRTPKGPLWHLVDVADTDSLTLCGKPHGVNPAYVTVDRDPSWDQRMQPAEAATCKKCIKAAAAPEQGQ